MFHLLSIRRERGRAKAVVDALIMTGNLPKEYRKSLVRESQYWLERTPRELELSVKRG